MDQQEQQFQEEMEGSPEMGAEDGMEGGEMEGEGQYEEGSPGEEDVPAMQQEEGETPMMQQDEEEVRGRLGGAEESAVIGGDGEEQPAL